VAAQIAIDRERAMTIMLSHIVGPSIINAAMQVMVAFGASTASSVALLG